MTDMPNWLLNSLRAAEEERKRKQGLQMGALQKLYSQMPPKSVTIKESYNRMVANFKKAADGDITKGRELPKLEDIGLADGRALQAGILYCDLRGYSALVSKHPKKKIILILDTFVTEMTRIAADFGGAVVDCAGDRIMAVFSKPHGDYSVQPIHKSVTCAFWMQTIIQKGLSPILKSMSFPEISCGIGIDYGPVVITRVGIRNNNKLVFLGDAANWAAKIEDIAEPGETNMSVTVYEHKPAFMTTAKGWECLPKPNSTNPAWYSCKSYFAGDFASIP